MEVRPRSHVDTPEWQNFEARMVARRAERRAQAARVRRARLVKGVTTAALLVVAAALGFAGTWIVQRPIARAVTSPIAPPAIALRFNEDAPSLPPPEAEAFPLIETPSPSDVAVAVVADDAAPPPPTRTVDAAAGTANRSARPLQSAPPSQASRSSVRVPPVSASRPSTDAAALEPRSAPVTTVPGTRENGGPQGPGQPVGISGSRDAYAAPPGSSGRDRTVVGTAGSSTPLPALMPGGSVTTSAGSAEARAADATPPADAAHSGGSMSSVSSANPVAPRTVPDSRAAVRNVLERYRLAYERLDAAAAGAVWPGVDRRALARAFDSLQSQQIDFLDCRILTAGSTAHATCMGRARAVPKIGSGGASEADRTWEFSLVQKGNDWQIAKATVK